MKKLILFSSLLFFFSFTENDWKNIFKSEMVSIKFKTADCNLDNAFKQRWFLLSFTNTSSEKITIEWDLELMDENQKCVTCNNAEGEYHYSLTLNPNETKEGECNLKCAPELRVVSKLLDVDASMSYPDFKLTNVKTITAK